MTSSDNETKKYHTELTTLNIINTFPSYKLYTDACAKFWRSPIYKDHLSNERKAIYLLREEDKHFDKDGIVMSKRIYKNKIDAHPIDKENFLLTRAIEEHMHKHFNNKESEQQSIEKIEQILENILSNFPF